MTDVAVREALGESLFPSQVNTYMTCPAKWYFRYPIGLSEPTRGALALGQVFHGTLARNFRQKLSASHDMEAEELREVFAAEWSSVIAEADLRDAEDADELAATGQIRIGLSEPTTGALALGKAFHGALARNFLQKAATWKRKNHAKSSQKNGRWQSPTLRCATTEMRMSLPQRVKSLPQPTCRKPPLRCSRRAIEQTGGLSLCRDPQSAKNDRAGEPLAAAIAMWCGQPMVTLFVVPVALVPVSVPAVERECA